MGVTPDNIQVSNICTVADNQDYFSARKQGINSGRIFTGAILN
ncbi:MAG: laccase domain-containing protein [Prevotella sp.]